MKWKSCLLLHLALTGLAHGQFVVPEGTTSILAGAYEGHTDLTNVVIPDSVTNIGFRAFCQCTNLTRITIGKGVTTIERSALATMEADLPGLIPGMPLSNAVSVCFNGDAPVNVDPHAFDAAPHLGSTYDFAPCNVTVYVRPGTTGWATTLAGRPVWNAQIYELPRVHNDWGKYLFLSAWGNTNCTVVLESCGDLANPVWSRIATNTMHEAGTPLFGKYLCSFSDPWTNSPMRLYRIRAEKVPWP